MERQLLADQSPQKESPGSQSPKAPLTEEEQAHEKKKQDEARKKARRRCVGVWVGVCVVVSLWLRVSGILRVIEKYLVAEREELHSTLAQHISTAH